MRINDLREKYADLLAPRFRGFECEDGWAGLADEMLAELGATCPAARIVQAKEKSGWGSVSIRRTKLMGRRLDPSTFAKSVERGVVFAMHPEMFASDVMITQAGSKNCFFSTWVDFQIIGMGTVQRK